MADDFAGDIAFVINLFEQPGVTNAEAAELAETLYSREEFVAHLFLRRRTFSDQPLIQKALKKAAASSPGIRFTKSSDENHIWGVGPYEEAVTSLRTALDELMNNDMRAKDVGDSVSDSLRRIAQEHVTPLVSFSDVIAQK